MDFENVAHVHKEILFSYENEIFREMNGLSEYIKLYDPNSKVSFLPHM